MAEFETYKGVKRVVNPTPTGEAGQALNENFTFIADELDSLTGDVAGKAAAAHAHDDRYFTESEVTTLLAAKATIDDNDQTTTKTWSSDFIASQIAGIQQSYSVEQLSDTTFVGLAGGDGLYYDGTGWINYPIISQADLDTAVASFTLNVEGLANVFVEDTVNVGDILYCVQAGDPGPSSFHTLPLWEVAFDNASTVSTTRGWTASKIATELAAKAASSHSHTLHDLSDVAITLPGAGDFVRYNGSGWENSAVAIGDVVDLSSELAAIASDLLSLTDTYDLHAGNTAIHVPSTGGVTNGWVLTNSSGTPAWAAASGGGATNLDGLSDVVITSAATRQVLNHNGTNWVNTATPTVNSMTLHSGALTFNANSGINFPTDGNFSFISDGTTAFTLDMDTQAATLNLPLSAHDVTASKRITSGVVALTDGATINTDAGLGNTFTVTLGGSRSMAAPSNPTSGQVLTYRIKQDGTGSRTISWNAVFRFSGGTAPTLTTTASKTDYVTFKYNAADTKWDCTGVTLNY